MSKQTKLIDQSCDIDGCQRHATIGVYQWDYGETDVNLNKPLFVTCGQHKIRQRRDRYWRNVKLARRVPT